MVMWVKIFKANIIDFHFYFINIDISVTISVIELRFSVCAPKLKVLLKGSVSQNFCIQVLHFI